MILDTKFRRETSNFKLNIVEEVQRGYSILPPIPDPEVKECPSIDNYEPGVTPIPGLIGKLPKNLDACDLVGMIISGLSPSNPTSQTVETINVCETYPANSKPFYEVPEVNPYPVIRCHGNNFTLWYIPHCGRVITEGFTDWDIYPVE